MASSRPILVIDDDAVIREAMEALLELEGYAVVVAADGDQALQRLRAGLEPSLIMVDLAMPAKDGFAFRREQLNDPRLAAIPTIAWSANYDPQEHENRLQGMAFLRKGVDLDTVLTCIEASLQQGVVPEAPARIGSSPIGRERGRAPSTWG
jgi:two-component system chemotaxis response regulator CheY